MNTKKLIVEVYNKTTLKELLEQANVPQGMMLVEGVFGVVDSLNRNKRFYARDEYAKHIELMQSRITESNGIFGELEHPKSMNIDLNNVSHKVTSVRLDEDGFVRGTILLLDTPKGQIAQSIVRSGSPLPISSRAIGQVQENGSVKLDFMSTYDLVGTSGFLEANVRQRVNESLDDQGTVISEMFEYDVDSAGNIVEESTMMSIIESVEARLLESFVNIDKVTEIVEAKLAAMTNAGSTIVNESANDTSVNEDRLIALMNERFANVYSPIIESWMTSEFAPKLGTSIQEWLSEDYANIVENWIKEDVLPANAVATQSWLSEEFAPKLGTSIQEWLSEDFAPQLGTSIQEWLSEDFAPQLGTSIQEWLTNDYATVTEAWLTEKLSETVLESVQSVKSELVIESQDASKPAKELVTVPTINESAEVFASKLLNNVDALILEAKEIVLEQPKEIQKIDECHYPGAPVWLRMIPAENKLSWQAMNEEQKEQVYKRASVRILESVDEVNRFWKSVNMSSILEPSAIKRSNTIINESVNDTLSAQKQQFAAYAKSMR